MDLSIAYLQYCIKYKLSILVEIAVFSDFWWFFANISRNTADREKLFIGIIIRTRKSILCLKMSKIGPVTEKMLMNNTIGNFDADNIVFETEVLAHHPEDLSLEIWEYTNFHQVP